MRITATDPFVRKVGRHLVQGESVRSGWPGTGLDVRFRGTRIEIDLEGTVAWLDLALDGSELAPFDHVDGPGRWALAELDDAEHVVHLRKRTEGMVGDLVVSSLRTDGQFLNPPKSPGLRLEFLGDSITCGYGCLDPLPEAGFLASTESFPLSWAGRTAALMGAEVHAQAISGIGMVRNWPGVVGEPLPERWKRAHQDHVGEWDLSRWVPHAVMVNLGSNDFGAVPFLADDDFVAGCVAFLRDIQSRRPKVPLVLVDGPLLVEGHPAPGTRTLVRSLLDRAASETGTLRFSLTPCDPIDGFGADWHPSVVQHERNAQQFADYLQGVIPKS